MARKLLRDDQYERIAGMLPAQPGEPGRKLDNRLFLEAVLWIARSGALWHAVFAELAKDADFEEAFIDSTIIKAHQHAAGAQEKRANKRLAARAAD